MYESCANERFSIDESHGTEPISGGHCFVSEAVNVIYTGKLPVILDPKTEKIIRDRNNGFRLYTPSEILSACKAVRTMRNK